MESFEIVIPLNYLSNVRARVSAVNRKMAKRGAPPFVLEEGERSIKTLAPRNDRDSVKVPAVALRISGEPFKIAGHKLIGVFYRGENGEPNRLVGFGSHKFTAEQQNPCSRCDHCQTIRERKVLFLLKDEASGENKQIGGDCAELYLGMSPARAINTISLFDEAMNILRMMEEELWEEDYSSGRNELGFPLQNFLASVAASIREHGWYSAARAEEMGVESTAHEAMARLLNSGEIQLADRLMAEVALAHWRGLFPIEDPQVLDEFEANLKQIAHSSHVSRKSFGRAAWMIQGYQAVLARSQMAMQAANSAYQGVQGEAIETVLRIDRCFSFDTQYGQSYIFSMSDAEGNAFVWKTASPPNGLTVGSITSVRAKVKEHAEYKGVRQTSLSHVKPEIRFAEFPNSPEEWRDAKAQAFLTTLAGGWFNAALAKGVDVASAMNTSTPPVMGLLIERWLNHIGMYREGAALAIKSALKAGADLGRLADYSLLGEYSLGDALKEHPELAGVLETPKAPRKRASPSMSI